ncbi:MAG: hypothetical protein DVB27_06590 [Verrucomicrobia bacterium]|nr:MAG: hypothetical protein DVB27_06590 [Verrucomicrobiota bacterium]
MREENSKFEIRNSKQLRNVCRGETAWRRACARAIVSKIFRCFRPASFGFRISDFGFFLLLLFCLTTPSLAQEDAPPPPKESGVSITFMPPPMSGVLSLGIYDKKGKLVRVLAREATKKDFFVGLNGFITNWDGKDDAGKPAPAGTYSARGFAVGELTVEGIAYHGNDWMIADDSPRLRRVLALELRASGRLALWAEGADGRPQLVRMDQAGEFAGKIPLDPEIAKLAVGDDAAAEKPGEAPPRAVIAGGKVALVEKGETHPFPLPDLVKPLDASLGREDRVWVIDQTAERTEVKEFSRAGEFHRHLAIDPAEPAPVRIFASRTSDLIFLIEEKTGVQRVRGLALEAAAKDGPPGKAAVSTWKTVLTKSIVASDTFAAVAGQLGRPQPFKPEDKIRVRLVPNPLFQEAMQDLDVQIGIDTKGTFLRAPDGLPIRTLTETPVLKWAVMGREGGKAVTVFQSDGALVEEFKVLKIANTMAFDAGDYEWAGK